MAVAQSRINYNITYFQSNYLLIFLIMVIYCLVTSPLLFFSVSFVGGAYHFVSNMQQDLRLGTVTLNQKQLYGYLTIVAIPLLWFSSLGGAVFWILGASGIIILSHAALLEPPVESQYERTV